MRIPRLIWDRRHNVASLTISLHGRVWDTRELHDVLLAYGATGRLVRIVFLDAHRQLPRDTTPASAATAALSLLADVLPEADLDVLRSAASRAA